MRPLASVEFDHLGHFIVGMQFGHTIKKSVHVYAYGPKTGPAFLRFFAFGVIRDGGVGWGY